MGDEARETLAAELAAQRERSRARSPESFAAADRLVERLRGDGMGAEAPQPGDPAPDFALPSARGAEIRLGDLLGRSAVVLVFYRGGW